MKAPAIQQQGDALRRTKPEVIATMHADPGLALPFLLWEKSTTFRALQDQLLLRKWVP
jgi:hypothetical protein